MRLHAESLEGPGGGARHVSQGDCLPAPTLSTDAADQISSFCDARSFPEVDPDDEPVRTPPMICCHERQISLELVPPPTEGVKAAGATSNSPTRRDKAPDRVTTTHRGVVGLSEDNNSRMSKHCTGGFRHHAAQRAMERNDSARYRVRSSCRSDDDLSSSDSSDTHEVRSQGTQGSRLRRSNGQAEDSLELPAAVDLVRAGGSAGSVAPTPKAPPSWRVVADEAGSELQLGLPASSANEAPNTHDTLSHLERAIGTFSRSHTTTSTCYGTPIEHPRRNSIRSESADGCANGCDLDVPPDSAQQLATRSSESPVAAENDSLLTSDAVCGSAGAQTAGVCADLKNAITGDCPGSSWAGHHHELPAENDDVVRFKNLDTGEERLISLVEVERSSSAAATSQTRAERPVADTAVCNQHGTKSEQTKTADDDFFLQLFGPDSHKALRKLSELGHQREPSCPRPTGAADREENSTDVGNDDENNEDNVSVAASSLAGKGKTALLRALLSLRRSKPRGWSESGSPSNVGQQPGISRAFSNSVALRWSHGSVASSSQATDETRTLECIGEGDGSRANKRIAAGADPRVGASLRAKLSSLSSLRRSTAPSTTSAKGAAATSSFFFRKAKSTGNEPAEPLDALPPDSQEAAPEMDADPALLHNAGPVTDSVAGQTLLEPAPSRSGEIPPGAVSSCSASTFRTNITPSWLLGSNRDSSGTTHPQLPCRIATRCHASKPVKILTSLWLIAELATPSKSPVWSLSISHDGLWIAAGMQDGTVRLWRVLASGTSSERNSLKARNSPAPPGSATVAGLAASGDHWAVGACKNDSSAQALLLLRPSLESVDLSSPRDMLRCTTANSSTRDSLRSSSLEGSTMSCSGWRAQAAAAGSSSRGKATRPPAGRLAPGQFCDAIPEITLTGHSATVVCCQWDSSATLAQKGINRLASASLDQTVRVWTIYSAPPGGPYGTTKHRRQRVSFVLHCSDWVTSVCFNPKSPELFYTACLDGTVQVWKVPVPREAASSSLATVGLLPSTASSERSGCIRHQANDAAAAQEPRYQQRRVEMREFIRMSDLVTAIAVSPSGDLLAVGHRYGKVSIHDARSLSFKCDVECKNRSGKFRSGRKVAGLWFSADSQSLCVSTSDSRLRVIFLNDQLSNWSKFKGHVSTQMMLHANYSPCEKFVVCGSEDSCVYIWDLYPSSIKCSLVSKRFDQKKRPTNCQAERFRAFQELLTSCIVAPAPFIRNLLTCMSLWSAEYNDTTQELNPAPWNALRREALFPSSCPTDERLRIGGDVASKGIPDELNSTAMLEGACLLSPGGMDVRATNLCIIAGSYEGLIRIFMNVGVPLNTTGPPAPPLSSLNIL